MQASRTAPPRSVPRGGEIQLRLSNARIESGSQNVYLVLVPDEGWTSALIHSAGLQLFAEGARWRGSCSCVCYGRRRLPECGGRSAFGVQSEEGSRSLENVCRRLLAERPNCPVVRGVVVLFPITWAGQPESVKWASSVREDLRTIERVLEDPLPCLRGLLRDGDHLGLPRVRGADVHRSPPKSLWLRSTGLAPVQRGSGPKRPDLDVGVVSTAGS